jgi:glycosyltransferase involved in cell wall biosynthesis
MPDPRVSVVMLTFNRPQFLSRAIESIRFQTLRDWELLVVHDGPNEEIARILADWAQREPRIRYLRRLQGGNIANATNHALRLARAPYIAILDDDDNWADPEKLQKQLSFLDANPDYVACGGGVITQDADGIETSRYLRPGSDQAIRARFLVRNPIAHASGVYRRFAIEQIGLHDESLPGYQDWDVWLKLGQVGKLFNFQDYFLRYTIWPGGGSFSQQKKNVESALRIVWRHRRHYPGFLTGLSLYLAHYAYAHTPRWFQSWTFSSLSRWKKTATAN